MFPSGVDELWASAHVILTDILSSNDPFGPDHDYICGYLDALIGNDGSPGKRDFSSNVENLSFYLDGRIDGVGDRESVECKNNEEGSNYPNFQGWG